MGERLQGKVAVITGGASGMGRATVLRFLEEGAAVVAGDLNEANGAALIAEVDTAGHGDKARFVRVDVAEEADVISMMATAIDQFGQIDIVFNNAGVGGAFGAVTDIAVEDWDYTFDVLVRGVFLGVKHAARHMLAQGWGGSIINTASLAAFSGGAGPLCYSAAKAAVLNLTRAAALELAPERIRVNAICPGPILTPLMHEGRPDAVTEGFATLLPWPEIGQPADIAGAALFYASADANFVTGDAMLVDGGLSARGTGVTLSGALRGVPPGFAGVNRGTTGQETVVRQRPPRN